MPNKRPPSAKPNKRQQPFRFSFGDNDFSTRKSTSNHLKDELNNLIKGNKNLKNVLEAIETFTKNLWNEKFCPGMLSSMNFGYRKKSKKSIRKGKKPTKALIRMCKRYHIKVTRKVGKKKVYKSVSVLKRLLKRKKKVRKSKKKNVRRKTRKNIKRQFHFGHEERAFEDAHKIIESLNNWEDMGYKLEDEVNDNESGKLNRILDALFFGIRGFIPKYYPTYAHGDLFCPI